MIRIISFEENSRGMVPPTIRTPASAPFFFSSSVSAFSLY